MTQYCTPQERVVIDVWIDFGDIWSFWGVSRLIRAIEKTRERAVDIDLHSYIGENSPVSHKDAEHISSLASQEGVMVDPCVLAKGLSESVRREAHRIMQAVKLGAMKPTADKDGTGMTVSASTPINTLKEELKEEYSENLRHSLQAGALAGLEISQKIQAFLLNNIFESRDNSPAGSSALSRDRLSVASRESTDVSFVSAETFPALGRMFSSEISEIFPRCRASHQDFLTDIDSCIAQDMTNARRLRIRGLPFVVVAGRFMVMGAQSPEVYRQLIADARQEIRKQDTSEGVVRIDI